MQKIRNRRILSGNQEEFFYQEIRKRRESGTQIPMPRGRGSTRHENGEFSGQEFRKKRTGSKQILLIFSNPENPVKNAGTPLQTAFPMAKRHALRASVLDCGDLAPLWDGAPQTGNIHEKLGTHQIFARRFRRGTNPQITQIFSKEG